MKVSIQDFQNKETGYTQEHDVDGMHIEIMRIEEGVNVFVQNIEARVDAQCDKCLKKYKHPVLVSEAERIFYFRKPPHYDMEADQADIFMADMKHQEVDLTEMLRQEILLHFPTSQVCSKSCKGLCLKCGADLNERMCGCDTSDASKKLLSGLRDLIS